MRRPGTQPGRSARDSIRATAWSGADRIPRDLYAGSYLRKGWVDKKWDVGEIPRLRVVLHVELSVYLVPS